MRRFVKSLFVPWMLYAVVGCDKCEISAESKTKAPIPYLGDDPVFEEHCRQMDPATGKRMLERDAEIASELELRAEEMAEAYERAEYSAVRRVWNEVKEEAKKLPKTYFRKAFSSFERKILFGSLRDRKELSFANKADLIQYFRDNLDLVRFWGEILQHQEIYGDYMECADYWVLFQLNKYRTRYCREENIEFVEALNGFWQEWIAFVESEQGLLHSCMRYGMKRAMVRVSCGLTNHENEVKGVWYLAFPMARDFYVPLWLDKFKWEGSGRILNLIGARDVK